MASSKYLVALALLLFALVASLSVSHASAFAGDAGFVMKRGGKGGGIQSRRAPHPAEAPKGSRPPRGAEAPEQEEGSHDQQGGFGKGSIAHGKEGRGGQGKGRAGKGLDGGLENGRLVGAPHAGGEVKGPHPEGAPRPDSSSHHSGKPRFPRGLLGGRGGKGGASESSKAAPPTNKGAPCSTSDNDGHAGAEAPHPAKGPKAGASAEPAHGALSPKAAGKLPKGGRH